VGHPKKGGSFWQNLIKNINNYGNYYSTREAFRLERS
jgi:hypothetical protein